jgi:hypothetical protein
LAAVLETAAILMALAARCIEQHRQKSMEKMPELKSSRFSFVFCRYYRLSSQVEKSRDRR